MSALFSFGIKQPDGTWKNYTGSINDKTDQYGNNVSIYESQTKEEREAKATRKYLANGKVLWTDGNIVAADKSQAGAGRSKPAMNNNEHFNRMMEEEAPF